ncbi:MAG: 23S rRNA (pseudouridine(1915)-N(3))-methyltransferase RlmH [Aestuariivirgaceae bacterium]
MRLSVRAIGRLKSSPEQALALDYLSRAEKLGRRAGIRSVALTEIAESRAGTPLLRQRDETDRLLAALPAGAVVIALDERGDAMTSLEFSAELRRLLDGGSRDLVFLIGGADGHAPELGGSARLLSLGRMTWPHALVRLMLAEQIYRSVTILINHPYHRA